MMANCPVLPWVLGLLLAAVPLAAQEQGLRRIEGLPPWLQEPPHVEHDLVGIGISASFGTEEQRRQQALERAAEALGRSISSTVSSHNRDSMGAIGAELQSYTEAQNSSTSSPVLLEQLLVLAEVVNQEGLVFVLATAKSREGQRAAQTIELRSVMSHQESADRRFEEELLELRRPGASMSLARSKTYAAARDSSLAAGEYYPHWALDPRQVVAPGKLYGIGQATGYPLYWATLLADQLARVELAGELGTEQSTDHQADKQSAAGKTQAQTSTSTRVDRAKLENSRIIRRYISAAGTVYSLVVIGE